MEEEKPPAAPAPSPAPARRGMRLWIVIAVIVVAAVILLAAWYVGVFSPPTNVLRIGTVLTKTGISGLEVFGPKNERGVDLAVKEINAAGGVLGNPIQVFHEDDTGDPATAHDRAQKLVSTNSVSAIIGATGSGLCASVLEVAKGSGVVEVSASCTSPIFSNLSYSGGWFFRTAPSDALQGVVAATYAYGNRSFRNMAVIGNDNPYGRGLANVFAQKFQALGGTAKVFVFPEKQTSYSSQLTSLFSAYPGGLPDALYMAEYPTDGLRVLQDWNANTAWSGVEWLLSEGLLEQTGFVDKLPAQGLSNTTIRAMEGSAPGAYLGIVGNLYNTFLSRYKAEYSGQDPGLFTANAYDAVYLLAAAAEFAGSASPAAIKGAMRIVSDLGGPTVTGGQWSAIKAYLDQRQAVNYQGASGSLDLDKFGDPLSGYGIWGINSTNKIKTVAYYSESTVIQLVTPPPVGTLSVSVASIRLSATSWAAMPSREAN